MIVSWGSYQVVLFKKLACRGGLAICLLQEAVSCVPQQRLAVRRCTCLL